MLSLSTPCLSQGYLTNETNGLSQITGISNYFRFADSNEISNVLYGYATNCTAAYRSEFSPETFDYRRATVEHVVDGDTVDLDIDLGFSIRYHKRVRLFGINAPEMKNDTNNVGHEAKIYLTQLIDNKEVAIKIEKDNTDKYGRYIVTIFLNGENINEKLVRAGKAERHNYE